MTSPFPLTETWPRNKEEEEDNLALPRNKVAGWCGCFLFSTSGNFGGLVLGCIDADCLQLNTHFAAFFRDLQESHTFAPLRNSKSPYFDFFCKF